MRSLYLWLEFIISILKHFDFSCCSEEKEIDSIPKEVVNNAIDEAVPT